MVFGFVQLSSGPLEPFPLHRNNCHVIKPLGVKNKVVNEENDM